MAIMKIAVTFKKFKKQNIFTFDNEEDGKQFLKMWQDAGHKVKDVTRK